MEAKQSNQLIQYGLMSAVVAVLFYIILYMGGVKFFMSPAAYFAYVIPIVFAVLACLAQKKENGGYLNFSEALKTSFGVFVITALFTSITSYVLMNYIDKSFAEAMQQATLEMTEKMMKRFGAPQDTIDKAVSDAANKNPFTLGKMFLGFAISCVLWFLFSLLISVIVRKNKPENEMPQTL